MVARRRTASRVYLSPHRRCLLRTERRNQGARWGLPSPDGELQYARRFHAIDDWISPSTRTFVELSSGSSPGWITIDTGARPSSLQGPTLCRVWRTLLPTLPLPEWRRALRLTNRSCS